MPKNSLIASLSPPFCLFPAANCSRVFLISAAVKTVDGDPIFNPEVRDVFKHDSSRSHQWAGVFPIYLLYKTDVFITFQFQVGWCRFANLENSKFFFYSIFSNNVKLEFALIELVSMHLLYYPSPMVFKKASFVRLLRQSRFTSSTAAEGSSGTVKNPSTSHSNVWSNSQGIIGEYAAKPVNLVTLNYLLTLKNGKMGFQGYHWWSKC